MEINEKNVSSAVDDVQNFNYNTKHPTSTTVCFGFGAMADQMSHQAFQFLVFSYYYAVVGLRVDVLAGAFILFAIWDSINDPLLGPLSDRTKSRFGRRGFWILVITVPFGLINIFLFTPPMFWSNSIDSPLWNTVYMIVIIMLYDLFYTVFSSNQLALFPEMFKTDKARARANKFKNIMTIVGLLLGFVFPTVLIANLVPTETVSAQEVNSMYVTTGIVICILVVIFGFLFFKFGMKEDPTHITKPDEMLGIFESLKITLKNKTFLIFVSANLFVWFIFKMLTTIISLYGIHVLGITDGNILLTVMLLAAFLTAAAMFPFMEWLGNKFGMRKAFMMTTSFWILALVPFFFLDNLPILAIVCMMFVGVGLSGTMFFVDIIIGRVIDEDELKTGRRRQGAYYGVNALINRYSTILVFLAVAGVLSGYGWGEYIVGASLEEASGIASGLKLLMSPISIVGLLMVLFFLWKFPLHGKRWEEVQRQLKEKRAQNQ
ncbi:hypothetical protein NEF87_003919 [Candidatus Lokiarchaeum ossiferum]|uniref:Major facilitator superfamily (MFS) profile domain-containing protein n=1 Tax=Candidatus Lokiarchaeum ossiferum TaxID=2951803 RepID=A0ABY6HVU7_9ARCH|nr:hypothetical protein NEF87_003919 [Candidatus Lokiarchaeum sp. B-35]